MNVRFNIRTAEDEIDVWPSPDIAACSRVEMPGRFIA